MVFLIETSGNSVKRYVVKDPLCLGRSCLELGERRIQKHILSFDVDPILTTGCCVRMIDRGCPNEKGEEGTFHKQIRKINIDKHRGIRLI